MHMKILNIDEGRERRREEGGETEKGKGERGRGRGGQGRKWEGRERKARGVESSPLAPRAQFS